MCREYLLSKVRWKYSVKTNCGKMFFNPGSTRDGPLNCLYNPNFVFYCMLFFFYLFSNVVLVSFLHISIAIFYLDFFFWCFYNFKFSSVNLIPDPVHLYYIVYPSQLKGKWFQKNWNNMLCPFSGLKTMSNELKSIWTNHHKSKLFLNITFIGPRSDIFKKVFHLTWFDYKAKIGKTVQILLWTLGADIFLTCPI